jgi:hypothetical protein
MGFQVNYLEDVQIYESLNLKIIFYIDLGRGPMAAIIEIFVKLCYKF